MAIEIYDFIGDSFWGGIGPRDIADQLRDVSGDITVKINSDGGDVFAGVTIFNMLRKHQGKIHVEVEGIAASIASVIAMAGDTIHIDTGAMMMIHDPWTFASGNAADFRNTADLLDQVREEIIGAYQLHVDDRDKIASLMEAETFMGGAEAVELGFATSYGGDGNLSHSAKNAAQAKFVKARQSWQIAAANRVRQLQLKRICK